MLGVCLLFVGIVLINNGMCTLYHVDGKSTAIMNIFTGGLSLFINFVNLLYLSFCCIKQVFKSRSHSFCMVFYLRGSQCRDLRNHRRLYRKYCTWNHSRYPLGRNLVSVGNSVGNCFCGGYLREKAGKICSISSGL